MDGAREKTRQDALRAIQKAGDLDWRAKARWLELSYQADYRPSSAKIEVNTNAQARQVDVVCDKATRYALIKGREQFLRDTAAAARAA